MIDNVNVKFEWYKGMPDEVTKVIPDKIIYDLARTTLDLSFPIMPERTGKMKSTSLARGVQGGNGVYRIGSYTDYASYVYNMPDSTNWTTAGTTSQWFHKTLQKYGNNILKEAVEREFNQ